ncbi:MAG: type II toxin-antitoxin system HipA family toxin [Lachnospiraceae bacterium]|nr:type II toxin-antitoxin system HipA family toxin [Lachnospiraceae bacterium]
MQSLQVTIEIEGIQTPVGTIRGDSGEDAVFSYDMSYLSSPEAAPISVHLPLRARPYSPQDTRLFFEGLLPEGFTRRSVAEWMRVTADDYLSMVAGLGSECLGAIQILTDRESSPPPSYRKMGEDLLRAFAREGASRSAELVTQAHLSLTGASGKAGLYYDRRTRTWYLPVGSAPSTHIVKQSHIRLGGIVTNEQLCLQTAANLGIPVPKSRILHIDDFRDENVLFATTRYDRCFPESADLIDGLSVPRRLHQEDFAQALGISPAEKYESPGKSYLLQMFSLLRRVSSNPIRDQIKLWNLVIFQILIGNADCHLKNYALLYSENLKSVRLAPAYDIISTVQYPSATREMAFHLGDEQQIDRIRRKDLEDAAREIGLGRSIAMSAVDTLIAGFPEALAKAAASLEEQGFTMAPVFQKQILEYDAASRLRK